MTDLDPISNPRRCHIAINNEHSIPDWYRFGMNIQIAVRLPDDIVAFVDDVIASGQAPTRAAVVRDALERQRRHLNSERDAVILARDGGYPDLDGLAQNVLAVSPSLD